MQEDGKRRIRPCGREGCAVFAGIGLFVQGGEDGLHRGDGGLSGRGRGRSQLGCCVLHFRIAFLCGERHGDVRQAQQVICRDAEMLRNLHNYGYLLRIYAILGEDYLHNGATPTEMNVLHRQLSGEDAFNRALDYLNRNYMDDMSLDSLAAYAGFSRYTLSRMFRQHTGETFTRYLSRRRVDMATELLAGTRLPVTQVALQCGFNSIATFNRVFREVKGCTPTQYRVIYGNVSEDMNTMPPA